EIREQVRAVLEAGETTQPIADPRRDLDEVDPYVPFVLYRRIDPSQPPPPGLLPLQAVTVKLIGDVRLQLQKRGVTAGACRPLDPRALPPYDGPEDRAILYFRLGAWTFAALIAEDAALDCWTLGIGLGLDPDDLTDAD